MGLVRLLLALSVVFAHSNENFMVGGQIAVQLFYVISGFLISFILNDTKAYQSPLRFYQNRALRIYPIYICVALLSLIAQVIANPKFLELYRSIPTTADAFLIFSNIFIFGQDWIMFTGIKNSILVFMKDFTESQYQLHMGLLVPQAWTLGIELSFYLLAPFVLRNIKIVIILLILSSLLRGLILVNGLGFSDPWTYRFFPLELALFFLGAISHKYLLPFWKNIIKIKKFTNLDIVATIYLTIFILFFTFIPTPTLFKATILYISFILILPLLFLFQKNRPIDKEIGDISYPLYICHVLVILITLYVSRKLHITSLHAITTLNILGALALAFILNIWLAKKIEILRNRIRAKR